MIRNISVFDIAMLLLKKLWAILLVAVIVGSVSYIWFRMTEVEKYSTSVSFLVSNTDIKQNEGNFNTIESTRMTKTFTKILSSNTVSEKVAQVSELAYSGEQVIKMIKITPDPEAEIMVVTVTAGKASHAYRIARVYAEVAPLEIENLAIAGSCKVLDYPKEKKEPLATKTTQNALLLTILAVVVVCGLFVVRELLDNTVKSANDLRANFDIPIIGTIPKMIEKSN